MKQPDVAAPAPQESQQTVAPLVISASRATDIPAFHAEWLMRRLRAGRCVRRNPFSGAKRLISFSHCKFIVFWSKNPAPFFVHIDELRARGFCFYLHYTLNDYVREGLEPGLPSLDRRIENCLRLAERIGRKRVIWRFDPVLLGNGLTVDEILERMGRLAEKLQYAAEKLIFSFVDIATYAKARARLRRRFPLIREVGAEEKKRMAEGIAALCAELKYPLLPASCAEKTDLGPYGIQPGRCVDAELLLRLWREDMPAGRESAQVEAELRALLRRKDPGQRRACGCAPSQDIGAYGTCPHACAYCYANPSEQAVRARLSRMSVHDESLSG